MLRGERPPPESPVGQQPCRRAALEQVGVGLALVHGGGHDAPGPDDAATQVSPDRQAEAVGPPGVRGVAAEPRMQAPRPGPAVRAVNPGSMADRKHRGTDLLAVIEGNRGRQSLPELPGRSPQPPDAPAGLALIQQGREQVRPVASDFSHEPCGARLLDLARHRAPQVSCSLAPAAGQDGEDFADGRFLAGSLRQWQVRLDLIAVAAAVFLLQHVTGPDEVGDDAVGAALGDAQAGREVAQPHARVAGDAQQHPAWLVRKLQLSMFRG
jgi:hypothetical protein